jgi:uncharacterized protein YjbJ (UPF0337 family)
VRKTERCLSGERDATADRLFLRDKVGMVSICGEWGGGKLDQVDMKRSTKNRTKGAFKEAKGRVKEAAGRATRSQRLQGKGRVEAAQGRVQRKFGELQGEFEETED